MAKKKVAKKVVKKVAKTTAMEDAPACSTQGCCKCNGLLALAIIILVWWKPAEMWSQIAMTIAAALILLSGSSCCKKK